MNPFLEEGRRYVVSEDWIAGTLLHWSRATQYRFSFRQLRIHHTEHISAWSVVAWALDRGFLRPIYVMPDTGYWLFAFTDTGMAWCRAVSELSA